MLISVFGLLDFGAFRTIDLGIVDRANNDAARALIGEIRALDTFDISDDLTEEEEREELLDGDRDLVLIIEPGFGEAESPVQRQVTVIYNQGRAQESAAGQTIIQHVLDEMTFAEGNIQERYRIDAEPVDSRNLKFIDFLMPGVVAMSIMQMGLFSVAFSFVQLKSRGVLRRLQAQTLQAGGPFIGMGSNLGRQWGRIVRNARVKPISLHDLRRTYITRLIGAGVPLPTVQKLAGHANIQTTLKYYNWVSDGDLREAVAKLARRAQ